ncbi:uncharacterized protein LOC115625095 [Scaptodrosophila lebanonensis]|uniref:Uncharacterized protein LOC115625095 n=1 Tax=Drosophila lebanonensis TaxID=7225 RepID=A0A6J2TIL7_DROLE|nr:uncharacterized protein LOC115625095 [Scaptodrosophila lebanonensis]
MSETSGRSHSEDSYLYDLLKTCANLQSLESLCPAIDYDCNYNDAYGYGEKMISTNPCSISGSSYTSEASFTEGILEENGRISLAYENLRTIPRRIADKFAAQTKYLDLSHNNFRNLSFLSFFEELHTLILDRNENLDVSTLPYLPSLSILWINNCNISIVSDWIHRIERQCPTLEHLSIMGNPGLCNLPIDYRLYCLQVLPNLKYLDGIPRCALGGRPHIPGRVSSSSCTSFAGHESTSASASDNRHQTLNGSKASSPTLSFKDLFRMKQRKKGGWGGGVGYSNGSSTN